MAERSSQRGWVIGDGVVDHAVEVEGHERLVGPEPGELLDAPHRLGAPGGGGLDDVEPAADDVHVARDSFP